MINYILSKKKVIKEEAKLCSGISTSIISLFLLTFPPQSIMNMEVLYTKSDNFIKKLMNFQSLSLIFSIIGFRLKLYHASSDIIHFCLSNINSEISVMGTITIESDWQPSNYNDQALLVLESSVCGESPSSSVPKHTMAV